MSESPLQQLEARLSTMPVGLRKWLECATEGLGRVARKRIADDIGAHYERAVDAAVESGTAEEEANRIALDELGDPCQAGRGFAAEFLTEDEERQFARLLAWIKLSHGGSARLNWTVSLLTIFATLAVLSTIILRGQPSEAQLLLSVSGFVIFFAGSIGTLSFNRLVRKRRMRMIGIAFPFVFLFVILGATTMFSFGHRGLFLSFVLVLGMFAGVCIGIGIPLRSFLKLRKVPSELTENEQRLLLHDCEWWYGDRTAIRKWEAKHGRRIWE